MPGDPAEPAGVEVHPVEPSNEERTQFHRATRDPGGGFRISWLALSLQKSDRMSEHRDAGSRRGDDDVAPGVELLVETVDGPGADGGGLAMEAGVEGRLSAAGLARVVVDGAAAPFEDFDRGFGGRRPELIDETGDEKGDPHDRSISAGCFFSRDRCQIDA